MRRRAIELVQLTSLGQETQLRVLGTLSANLYTGVVLTRTHKPSSTTEPPRPQLMTSYRVMGHLRHQLRHSALYYVTNLEYLVIENHLSASGLRLAPQLTHAPSGQRDDRGTGDNRAIQPYPLVPPSDPLSLSRIRLSAAAISSES